MNKEHITVVARAPAQCSARESEAFQRLVLAGGEVASDTLPGLVASALCLAFATNGNEIVAVAGLKRPNPTYRARVFEKSGATTDYTQYEFELGWVFVHPSARNLGLSTTLVESLVPTLRGAKAYATSRVDNERMHSTLKRVGFAPVGAPYPSQRRDANIQLFVC